MTAKNAKNAKNAAKPAAKPAKGPSKAKQKELEARIEPVTKTKPAKTPKQAKAAPVDNPLDQLPPPGDKPARNWARGPKQNHSTVESPCRIVWDLFDAELARAKSLDAMVRKDVIDAALAKGVNIDTAKTQYQRRRAQHLGK